MIFSQPFLMSSVLIACQTDKEPRAVTETADAVESIEVGVNPRVHRLTHLQWANSVEALTGVDVSLMADSFQQSTLSEGFSNNGEILSIDSILFQDYQRAAEGTALAMVSDLEAYGFAVPEDPRQNGSTIAYTERVEAESSDAVATTGGVSGTDRYNLWSNGTLSVEFDLPSPGLYSIRTLVSGTTCSDGLGAMMEIRLDGETLTEAEVQDPVEVVAEAEISAGVHIVSIAFANDCYEPDDGFDRNLYIDWIEVSGGVDLGESTQTVSGMSSWVERFVSDAYRRPLTETEVSQWLEVFQNGAALIQSGDDIADGVQLVTMAVLQSPYFLYRLEQAPPNSMLDDYELSSKLSFQLCNRPPDEEMKEDLANGTFLDSYREHAERMLLSECGQDNLLHLHEELFHWDGYANIDQPDASWDTDLNALFSEEIQRFIAWHLYVENGTLRGLYTADYTLANARLASLYGLDDAVVSEDFERIELNPSERSGILTLLGPLAYKSDVGQSSPIHRGVFINDAILCKSLPPPPDVVPNLPPQDPELTNRERVEAHTGAGTCGEGCHSALINPPGFAFEQYDELGRFRAEDGGHPIDASDSYYFVLDGLQTWQTGVEFTHIVAESQEAHQCYAQHLLTYFLGRPIQEADTSTIEAVGESSLNDSPILELVLGIVQSDAFRMRGEE